MMPEDSPAEIGPSETLVEMERLNGLSDGVFAFALTLLVLDIRVPQDGLVGDLPERLVDLAPRPPGLPDQFRRHRRGLGIPPAHAGPDPTGRRPSGMVQSPVTSFRHVSTRDIGSSRAFSKRLSRPPVLRRGCAPHPGECLVALAARAHAR